ncbi:Sugar phosphate isomerase/epimerase [Brevinema andersonii]|uniref:Sugar phosphate isomerase/epimerase n=1 Tax=Brevinema andersonii TaxID=34097 RepID=A0A1I1EZC1_BREAD|nr:TIM barrel protein [Brevinema andersonii]SFB92539.1 Sugar phosphate isomerase/epimerase [Brevinema andersonii]
MKLCVSNLAWNNNERIAVYKLLQQNNIKHIEIALSKFSTKALNENIKAYLDFKDEWESYGLTAVSMQSLHFGVENAYLFRTGKQRNNLLEATKKAISIASCLEIQNLVFGSPKLRIIPNRADTSKAVNFFTKLNTFAQSKNCYLNLEANSKQYGTNFLTTTQEALQYLKDNQWSNIGINLDIGTIILENENIEEMIPHFQSVRHVHLSIPYLKTNFEEYRSQIQYYISEFKKSNHTVFSILSLEMYSNETNLNMLEKNIYLIQEYIQ